MRTPSSGSQCMSTRAHGKDEMGSVLPRRSFSLSSDVVPTTGAVTPIGVVRLSGVPVALFTLAWLSHHPRQCNLGHAYAFPFRDLLDAIEGGLNYQVTSASTNSAYRFTIVSVASPARYIPLRLMKEGSVKREEWRIMTLAHLSDIARFVCSPKGRVSRPRASGDHGMEAVPKSYADGSVSPKS
jgi:hypothetical protein